MIAVLDVRYDEVALTGKGAAVVVERRDDVAPITGACANFTPASSTPSELPPLLRRCQPSQSMPWRQSGLPR